MDCRPINGWTNWFYTPTTVGEFLNIFYFKNIFKKKLSQSDAKHTNLEHGACNIRIVGLIPGTTGHEKYMPA